MRSLGISRRQFLGSIAAAGLATGAWMRYIEPWRVRQAHHTVPLGLGGLKLLHLSDLHANPMPLDFIAQQIERGLAWKPDLICVTGDFITARQASPDWDAYAGVLSKLAQFAPTFAVLGNHDSWAATHPVEPVAATGSVRSLLKNANLRLLDNTTEQIVIRDRRIRLVGLADYWAKEFDPVKAFASRAGQDNQSAPPTIVLSHNPDSKDPLSRYPWDLLLSGHTHGGQISLPWIGQPLAPVRDKRFVRGLASWNGRWIHVTAGIGSLHKMRLNCPPEISCLTLA
jgi:predicted MPP superfamily phosphohydrolase